MCDSTQKPLPPLASPLDTKIDRKWSAISLLGCKPIQPLLPSVVVTMLYISFQMDYHYFDSIGCFPFALYDFSSCMPLLTFDFIFVMATWISLFLCREFWLSNDKKTAGWTNKLNRIRLTSKTSANWTKLKFHSMEFIQKMNEFLEYHHRRN